MVWPIKMSEDVYGVTDLRDSLPQVVDKAAETKRPMIITKHSRPVAAIVDIDELQEMYEEREALEELRDRNAVLEVLLAESHGEIEWLSNEEMSRFMHEVVTEAESGA
ncbi:MAG: type II toxin-antitoxin system Phd/YefM family antitoxin [Chloroflexota bacterium]|nr:MAG: type II toxin-antitoxin system Phd/YefM family antitoxin [Chloroflexota bacterium]